VFLVALSQSQNSAGVALHTADPEALVLSSGAVKSHTATARNLGSMNKLLLYMPLPPSRPIQGDIKAKTTIVFSEYLMLEFVL